MTSGSVAAWAAGAALALGIAACGGSTSGGTHTGGGPSSAPAAAPAQTSAPAGPTGSGGLTPPGTQLGFGGQATVGWIPPTTALKPGAHEALRFQVTVESIEKGTIDDFKNVDLDSKQKKETPYYVKVKLTALGKTAWKGTDDPAISFRAIDDRGQEQGSITFFGTFERCDEVSAPKPFTAGKSYESCFAYLLPGGGSIQKVEWNDGPTPANGVSVYFDKPIVWAAG
jgi:hypothetical protein